MEMNKLYFKQHSAVNQIDVTNAATGNSPSIQATGGDSNMISGPKGLVIIEILGATNPGSIQLNCENNTWDYPTYVLHTVQIDNRYTIKFPIGNITAGTFLKVDSISGSGATGQVNYPLIPHQQPQEKLLQWQSYSDKRSKLWQHQI